MLVVVGSLNPVKINGAEKIFKDYRSFGDFQVIGVEINSGVREQPIGKKETYLGAINRAQGAFESTTGVKYGVGIEDGVEVTKVDGVDVGMIISTCVIYDGKRKSRGEGGSYQVPRRILERVLEREQTIDQVIYDLGMTMDKRVGQQGGLVSLLTNGTITRQDIIEQSLKMALISALNRRDYH